MTAIVLGIVILGVCALLLATVMFAILWAGVSGVASAFRDLRDGLSRGRSRLPRQRASSALPSAPADQSPEALYHRMQGTSKTSGTRRARVRASREAAKQAKYAVRDQRAADELDRVRSGGGRWR